MLSGAALTGIGLGAGALGLAVQGVSNWVANKQTEQIVEATVDAKLKEYGIIEDKPKREEH